MEVFSSTPEYEYTPYKVQQWSLGSWISFPPFFCSNVSFGQRTLSLSISTPLDLSPKEVTPLSVAQVYTCECPKYLMVPVECNVTVGLIRYCQVPRLRGPRIPRVALESGR